MRPSGAPQDCKTHYYYLNRSLSLHLLLPAGGWMSGPLT